MNLRQLTTAELSKAREATEYLCSLRGGLDSVLAVKLDTFHADLMAEIEDRAHGDTAGSEAA